MQFGHSGEDVKLADKQQGPNVRTTDRQAPDEHMDGTTTKGEYTSPEAKEVGKYVHAGI